MTPETIASIASQNDFDEFNRLWTEYKNQLTEQQKQALLTEIVDWHYEDERFSYFKKIFDLIIDSKVSLDFSMEHWAPTFLSLSVHKISRQLFNYFIKRGASLNYIGDIYAFEEKEFIEREVNEWKFERYATCLDFALIKLADFLTTDYHYYVPENLTKYNHWEEATRDEQVTLSARDYMYLLDQSKYLRDLIHLDKLVDHIKSLGGKTYNEIKQEKPC